MSPLNVSQIDNDLTLQTSRVGVLLYADLFVWLRGPNQVTDPGVRCRYRGFWERSLCNSLFVYISGYFEFVSVRGILAGELGV